MHSTSGTEPPDEQVTQEVAAVGDIEQQPSQRDWAGILVAFIAIGIAVVGLLSIFSYSHTNRELAQNSQDISKETRRAQREECVRVEIVKAALRGVVAGTVPSDKTGPGASYYREHPDELKAAREGSRKTIKAFAQQDCPGLDSTQLSVVLNDALKQIAAGKQPRPTEKVLKDAHMKPDDTAQADPALRSAVARATREQAQAPPATPPARRPARPLPERPVKSKPPTVTSTPQAVTPQPTTPSATTPAPVTPPAPPPGVPPGAVHVPPKVCENLPPTNLNNPLCP